ncbi:MAG: glycerol kinase GlpK [Planctomycetota bacterium]
MPTLLALDQGTTSSRAILFDAGGKPLGVAQQEFAQHFPRPGRVEHNPQDLWATQRDTARRVLAEHADSGDGGVAALGIANQRETTLVWERTTGRPVAPAIVWQDRRTADACDRLVADGLADTVRHKTGLVIDAYFSATKLVWVLDHADDGRARAARGELCFGTVDTWLIHRLTSGRVHATDPSNASRTMLFNIHSLDWDDDLLALFDIPREMLPDVVPSSGVLGETDPEHLGRAIPIAGVAGDQQAALFGNRCVTPGSLKTTYGTGCFMLLNVGDTPVASEHRLLSTVAWQIGDDTTYALEGSVFIGGATVQWLRDGLGIIENAADVEALAASVPDAGGLVLVPAFAGLGAPHWDQYARGLVTGITRGTTRAHVARAALEGIAFQVADVFGALQQDYGRPIAEMRVDGGASANDLLMQLQADLTRTPVVRPGRWSR